MALSINLVEAARRARRAAQDLDGRNQHQVAGYLYGLAAECAVKEVARQVPCTRTDEILYAHFPELRNLILDVAQGRAADRLRRVVEHGSFLSEWTIKVRYAPNSEVTQKQVDRWKKDADSATMLMEET